MSGTPSPRAIVVGFDGSPAAGRAMSLALEIARAGGGRIYLVHAQERDPEQAEPATEEESVSVEQAIAAAVAGWAERAAGASIPFTAVQRDRPAAELLRSVAKEVGADLVVVGTRGLGPASKAWLGSVSSSLLTPAERPVLVVP
ncbi:MAG: universal stress protein [Thermoplasmatales archaeon]|nr:universal stress protein [Thermoplasmatales archaeon]